MKWKYDEYLGERCSRAGSHFTEHKSVNEWQRLSPAKVADYS